MADDPADIGGGPENIARINVVDRLHGPFQRNHVAAGRAHHAFRLAGGAGGIEDIGGVHRIDGNAVRRGGAGLKRLPFHITLAERSGGLFALADHAELGFVGREFDRAVDQGLVVDHAPRFDPAACGDDRLWRRIVDPDRKLRGREAAEDHRMHRTNARACEHGDQRVGDHWHIDDHTVALAHAPRRQRARQPRDPALKPGIGDLSPRFR